jgi:hypothetical protein
MDEIDSISKIYNELVTFQDADLVQASEEDNKPELPSKAPLNPPIGIKFGNVHHSTTVN